MAPEADGLPAGPHRWHDFLALDEDDLRELVDGRWRPPGTACTTISSRPSRSPSS